MIVAVTTSCAQAGVAVFEDDGTLIDSNVSLAPMASSAACLKMLEGLLRSSGLDMSAATLFLADLGPGSFTGVKVGVTLAKTWGFAFGVPVGGVASFDLIDPEGTVVLPCKRGEYYVRRPGQEPIRTYELPGGPFRGFGPGVEPAEYPNAELFGPVLSGIERLEPEALVPNYVSEPSISTPKKPYGPGGAIG